MGVKYIRAVVAFTPTSDLSATEVLILFLLADHKNDMSHRCDPSVETLSAISRLNERSVRRTLRSLEKRGLITSRRRFNDTTMYSIKLRPIGEEQPDLFEDAQPDSVSGRGGAQSPPNQNLKPEEEPVARVTRTRPREDKPSKGKAKPVAYRFEGEIIRLTEADYVRWCDRFTEIDDLTYELNNIEEWLVRYPERRQANWFKQVERMLQRKHDERAAVPKTHVVELLPETVYWSSSDEYEDVVTGQRWGADEPRPARPTL